MAKECETCAHKSDFKSVECGSCTVGFIDGVQQGLPSNYKAKPMTNADRIRAMSDEELARFLLAADQGNFTVDVCDERFCDLDNCSHDCTAALKWLQQPAEGDADGV